MTPELHPGLWAAPGQPFKTSLAGHPELGARPSPLWSPLAPSILLSPSQQGSRKTPLLPYSVASSSAFPEASSPALSPGAQADNGQMKAAQAPTQRQCRPDWTAVALATEGWDPASTPSKTLSSSREPCAGASPGTAMSSGPPECSRAVQLSSRRSSRPHGHRRRRRVFLPSTRPTSKPAAASGFWPVWSAHRSKGHDTGGAVLS